MDEIPSTNIHIVGANTNGDVTVMNPKPVYTKEEAINLAAWIIAISVVNKEDDKIFKDVLQRIITGEE